MLPHLDADTVQLLIPVPLVLLREYEAARSGGRAILHAQQLALQIAEHAASVVRRLDDDGAEQRESD